MWSTDGFANGGALGFDQAGVEIIGISDSVSGAAVDGFLAAFAVPAAHAAEAKAKQDAVDAVGAVRKLADAAAALRATSDDDGPDALLEGIDLVAVAGALEGRLAPVERVATTKDRIKAYERIGTDAKSASDKGEKALTKARGLLAKAEKSNLDKLDAAGKTERLQTLAAGGRGRQIVDAMVAGIGSNASSTEDKAFVTQALKARFDVELGGNLSNKSLPRLYALLGRVPDSHTRDNEGLQKINRQRSGAASDYSADGTINLRCGRGLVYNRVVKGSVEGSRLVDYFDHTTLHEVGHSVNAKFQSNPIAGWRAETDATISAIVLDHFGFRAIPGYPPPFATSYVAALLAGRAPEGDAALTKIWQTAKGAQQSGVTLADLAADGGVVDILAARTLPVERTRKDALRAIVARNPMTTLKGNKAAIGQEVCLALIANPDKSLAEVAADLVMPAGGAAGAEPDWRALKAHAGVVWFNAVKMSGDHAGLWSKGDGGTAYAVSGRIYQESYKSLWNSYDAGARRNAVSNYQFRAPGEWFAELYGIYYMKKLPTNHPQYRFFKDTVDR
jgi:hypothetical protein